MGSARAKNWDLRTGQDPNNPTVKTYSLVPPLGVIHGYGVDKGNLDDLAKTLQTRNLARQDCIYLLLSRMLPNYVGQTQKIVNRLKQHASQRTGTSDWDRVLVIFVRDQLFNTSIASFVEYALYLRLVESGFPITQNTPADRVLDGDNFEVARSVIEEIERLLELLDLAQPTPTSRVDKVASLDETKEDLIALEGLRRSDQHEIEVELSARGVRAHGKYTGFGLLVYAGSTGTAVPQPHMRKARSYWRMRKELEEEGVLEIEDEHLRFLQSYTFASPTAAAHILTGSNRPGPLVWKRKTDGKTLKELSD